MVEFGTGLRARLAREIPMASNDGSRRRIAEAPDLRLFYELLTSETFVFSSFKPTAPRPKGRLAQRLS
jgi:hypothetical protein